MAFHGLFIGIDRYAKPINWLSCAKRDASALHALHADTMGLGGILLSDSSATRRAIEAEFRRLATEAQPEDLVVIAFSGHGTETHELVTFDTDVSDLQGTGIPLETLGEWLSAIRAKRVLCVLDCCFSGGMGARGLTVDAVPRDIPSEETLLSKIAGEGRVILTATLPSERAWEIGSKGHGLLTYHLLEALEGAEEVRAAGRISTFKLLEYVTKRVIASAAAIGKSQNPTVRGTIDGSFEWPVFRRGAAYATAFPDRTQARVTADLKSLAAFGFPDTLIEAWGGAIPNLNALQQDAINDFGVLTGQHVLVSAPTSSGKTMIGELAALKGVLERRRALFLFPLKALANDKLKHFERVYESFGVRTIRVTGDSTTDDIIPLMRGQYDIALLTYEKFAALITGNPFLLEQVGTVVIDEVQMIADQSRGVNLEFLMTLLRVRRQHGTEPQVLALSAVIGDTNGFEHWLGGRLLRRFERPVPLDEGIIRANGSFRFIASDTGEEKTIPDVIRPEFGKGSSQDIIKPLTRKLVQQGQQVIVFRETRGEARGCANYLAEYLGLPPARAALEAVPVGDPSLATGVLRKTLEGGVAFHISDLDVDERVAVEEHFRARPTTLRVIAATTTLAMGVNTPAESVIIAGLEHPGDPPAPYSVAEYKNMAGRAGRLGFAARGTSFLVAQDGHDEQTLWRKYVLGKPEDLASRFLARGTDPRSVVLRVLAAVQSATRVTAGMSHDEIIAFLENSFGVFQQRQKAPSWNWNRGEFDRAVESLKKHGLLEDLGTGKLQITELGRFPGESGVEVETVIRVVDAMSRTASGQISDPSLIALTQLTLELDELSLPMHPKSQKEPATWFQELRRQGILESIIGALQRNADSSRRVTLRAKRAGAALLSITDMPMEEIEGHVTRYWGKFDGAAGPLRGVRSRTADLLPVVARIVEIKNPGLSLGERVERLVVRLELGVPASLVDLGRLIGTRLTRADYLSLLRSGKGTIEAISAAPDETLLEALGGSKEKLRTVRTALHRPVVPSNQPPTDPILPTYVA